MNMKHSKFMGLVWVVLLLVACGGSDGGAVGDVTNDPNNTQVEPLTMFEEALARKWSRYHAYDASYMYFVFKGDRTACYFEISSSGSRIKETKYIYWELTSMGGSTTDYYIVLTYEGGSTTSSNEFYYDINEIWKGGYSNLDMFPSTTSRDCS